MHYGWDTMHYGWDTTHYGWDTMHYGWDTMHYGAKIVCDSLAQCLVNMESTSPTQKSTSPRQTSTSPRQKSTSPTQKSTSPTQKSTSPGLWFSGPELHCQVIKWIHCKTSQVLANITRTYITAQYNVYVLTGVLLKSYSAITPWPASSTNTLLGWIAPWTSFASWRRCKPFKTPLSTSCKLWKKRNKQLHRGYIWCVAIHS